MKHFQNTLIEIAEANEKRQMISDKATPMEVIAKLMDELNRSSQVADIAIDTLQEILQSLSDNVITEEGKFKRVLFNLGAYGKAASEIKDSVEEFIKKLKEITADTTKIEEA